MNWPDLVLWVGICLFGCQEMLEIVGNYVLEIGISTDWDKH